MNDKTQTYVERNKGKLRLYQIVHGKHTRSERTESGSTTFVTYSATNPDHTLRKILLTEAGARELSKTGMKFREVGSDAAASVKSQSEGIKTPINIPEDWEDLPAGNKRALAELISGEKVKNASDATDIIDAYLAEQSKKEASGTSDEDEDDDSEE